MDEKKQSRLALSQIVEVPDSMYNKKGMYSWHSVPSEGNAGIVTPFTGKLANIG
jgi:hypothetical protein